MNLGHETSLLSAAGIVFEVIKKLAQQTVDHGGSEEDIRRIVREPELAARLAKMLVGPIWDHVGVPVKLNVDWTSAWEDLARQCPFKITMGTDAKLRKAADELEVQSMPAKDEYQLVHFQEDVRAEYVAGKHSPAGIRELMAYLKTVKLPRSTRVVALGSIEKWTDSATTYGYAEISSMSTHIMRIDARNFDPSYFFLVRA